MTISQKSWKRQDSKKAYIEKVCVYVYKHIKTACVCSCEHINICVYIDLYLEMFYIKEYKF